MNQTKFKLFAWVTVIALVTSLGVWVQVKSATQETNAGAPEIVSYQGNIWDGDTPFTGTGYFRFAIMDTAGTRLRWSNDGADPPASSVTRDVINGLFSVNLGDTTLPGMSDPLTAAVFDNPNTRLRVWFSPDDSTWTQMPDQVIAAVPYALQAQKAVFSDIATEAINALHADTLDGLHANAFQLRVTGTCPEGQAIRQILEDGSVTCEFLNDTPTFTLTTVASTGDVGKTSSIAIGSDGLGIISYYDNTTDDLMVYHCENVNCTSGTSHSVDTIADVGQYTSIAIGTDGYPLISYYDLSNSALKVAHCNDVACISSTITILDSANDVGKFTSITIAGDGYGLISYYDATNGHLRVAHCTNITCSAFTINIVDDDNPTSNDVGQKSHIVTGTDGYGMISYYDSTDRELRLAHCGDYACTMGNARYSVIDFIGSYFGLYNDIIIGPSGNPLIASHYENYAIGEEGIYMFQCFDIQCESSYGSELLGNTDTLIESISLTLGPDGCGLLSFGYVWDDLAVTHCDNEYCFFGQTSRLDTLGSVGSMSSIIIGEDGLALISYYDETNGDLKVAHCSNELCLPINRGD